MQYIVSILTLVTLDHPPHPAFLELLLSFPVSPLPTSMPYYFVQVVKASVYC